MNNTIQYKLRAKTIKFPDIQRRYFKKLLLEPPTVLFQNNHLLAVHKPAGWHVTPNQQHNNQKCLLHYLQAEQYGGGSLRDFLLPMHRLDQPCTGVTLFARTKRAASRIQTRWKDLAKKYVCVLDHTNSNTRSKPQAIGEWHTLHGYCATEKNTQQYLERIPSVTMEASPTDTARSRYCELRYQYLTESVILVETSHGAKHMIRALLAQRGPGPIAGDVRYGASNPLTDQSVALHARSVTLPEQLPLGNSMVQREFVANIPVLWKEWFGITEEMMRKLK